MIWNWKIVNSWWNVEMCKWLKSLTSIFSKLQEASRKVSVNFYSGAYNGQSVFQDILNPLRVLDDFILRHDLFLCAFIISSFQVYVTLFKWMDQMNSCVWQKTILFTSKNQRKIKKIHSHLVFTNASSKSLGSCGWDLFQSNNELQEMFLCWVQQKTFQKMLV